MKQVGVINGAKKRRSEYNRDRYQVNKNDEVEVEKKKVRNVKTGLKRKIARMGPERTVLLARDNRNQAKRKRASSDEAKVAGTFSVKIKEPASQVIKQHWKAWKLTGKKQERILRQTGENEITRVGWFESNTDQRTCQL